MTGGPIWLALSLLLGALLLGTTFAHVLEIRAKARMDGALWTTLQHRLYRAFATVGGAVEIGAVAFFVVWIGMVQPVNRQVARWNPATVPADWRHWRQRWDAGHAIRFGLHLVGFGLLVGIPCSTM